MELIINIHKKDYQSILNSGQVPYGVVCAIMNGTPLPKGHGRLIDAERYRNEMFNSRDFDFFKTLDMQPTIIESDKSESEEP